MSGITDDLTARGMSHDIRSVLVCNVCSSELQLKLLRCLHSMCESCLDERFSKPGTDPLCPSCACPIKSREQSQADHSSLVMNELARGISALKATKQQPRPCDYCTEYGPHHKSRDQTRDIPEASFYCTDCRDFICNDCSTCHKRTKLTRDHRLIARDELTSGKHDDFLRNNHQVICEEHDEPKNIFCQKCEELICTQCKVREHDDHPWKEPEDAQHRYVHRISLLSDRVDGFIPSVTHCIDELKRRIQERKEEKEKLQKEIRKQTKSVIELIRQEGERLEEQVERTAREDCASLQLFVRSQSHALSQLSAGRDYSQDLLHCANSSEMLSTHKTVTAALTQLLYKQIDAPAHRVTINFLAGCPSEEDARALLGEISVHRLPDSHSGLRAAPGGSGVLPELGASAQLQREFDCRHESDTSDVWPTGVITIASKYYIIDRGNRCLKCVDPISGEVSVLWRCEGNPYDITQLPSGCLVVSDTDTASLHLLTASGQYMRPLHTETRLRYPRGLSVTLEGSLALVDGGLRCLLLINPNSGSTLLKTGSHDNAGNQLLTDPHHVISCTSGNFFVSDWAEPNIKVFESSGRHVGVYGDYGTRSEQLLQPHGLTCDALGYVFVSDNSNHRVHVLSPAAQFQKFVVTKQHGVRQPMAVGIDPTSGVLLITEALGKLKVFKYM